MSGNQKGPTSEFWIACLWNLLRKSMRHTQQKKMYIHIYIYIHIYLHMYTYCKKKYIYTHIFIRVLIYIYTHMYYVYIYIYIHTVSARIIERNRRSTRVRYSFPYLFSPNSVSMKARCLIEVFSGVSGIFPLNFHTKWLL